MSAISQYIIKEYFKVFCCALVVMVLPTVFFIVVKELQQEGFGLKQIALILPYVLPNSIKAAVHAALLFAACNVFGRLASSNELLAIKSMGISPLRVLLPVFLATLPLSWLAVWLDEVDSTWAAAGVKNVTVNQSEAILYGALQRNRNVKTGNFKLVVKGVEGQKLLYPTLQFQRADGDVMISATSAQVYRQHGDSILHIAFHDGHVLSPELNASFADSFDQEIPLKVDPVQALTMDYLRELEQRLCDVTTRCRAEIAAGAAAEEQEKSREEWQAAWRKLIRQRTQYMHKWASGFCCLCFVLIGAPMAILMRAGNWLISFFICFLPVVLIYQPLRNLPIALAEDGMISPLIVWTPDLVFACVGIELVRRVVRH